MSEEWPLPPTKVEPSTWWDNGEIKDVIAELKLHIQQTETSLEEAAQLIQRLSNRQASLVRKLEYVEHLLG